MKLLKVLLFFTLFTIKAQAAGVAVISPQKGDEAVFGHQIFEGVKIAVDVINENGGLLGEKIELININDSCSKSVFEGLTSSLRLDKESGIKLIIGPYCQNNPHIMGFLENITQIIPQPLSLSNYNHSIPNLYKIGGRILEQTATFFSVYKEHWINKNVALIYDRQNNAAYETALELQNIFNSHDLNNRINLYEFNSYQNNYKKMAKEILRNNDIVYILGNKKQIASLAQKLQEKNDNVILVVDSYMATPYLFKELGNFAEGIYVLRVNDQKSNAFFTKELVNLRIKNKEPRGLGIFGYAAIMLWQDMVKKAQTFDAKTIDTTANKQKWSLPWGKVEFQQGRPLTTGGWNMYIYKDGEYTQVN